MEIECGSNPIRKFFIPSDFDNDLIADCVDPDDDNDGCLDEEDHGHIMKMLVLTQMEMA